MLKEKYCDSEGTLPKTYPTIHQFKYFYRKTKSLQKLYISRNGIKDYQRNFRPLTGSGVNDFATNIGTAMLDSTVCDIYLVNESGNLIGRPNFTACVDGYSRICYGFSLSFDGGVKSLVDLMENVISDKHKLCSDLGIEIQNGEWECKDCLPGVLVTDRGKEYESQRFAQITELGCSVINLPSYRPELKGVVEKFFDVIQSLYKPHLKGKGIIEPDYSERGAHDYRKDACLTLSDFRKIIIHCILYYNSKRIIKSYPLTEQMLNDKLKPIPTLIWEYAKPNANLIKVNKEILFLTLLPRTTA